MLLSVEDDASETARLCEGIAKKEEHIEINQRSR